MGQIPKNEQKRNQSSNHIGSVRTDKLITLLSQSTDKFDGNINIKDLPVNVQEQVLDHIYSQR